jgi:hypothetical protein
LHGWHQVAVKSTSTGVVAWRTSVSKLSEPTTWTFRECVVMLVEVSAERDLTA